MTDYPILFQAPMVNAILAGGKKQTRRICKGLPIIENAKYKIGDTLWIRENARFHPKWDDEKPRNIPAGEDVRYCADMGRTRKQWGRVRPSIHVPRRFTRIWLLVENVRIQRLNDISAEDALAEGVKQEEYPAGNFGDVGFYFVPGIYDRRLDPPNNLLSRSSPRDMFAALWDTVNGSGEWLKNPYVFAYTIKRINKPKGE